MASGSVTNLCCPVCHDVYRDPVLLSCSHSFCAACLRRWWRRREALQCPVCKRVSGRKRPPRNLALKNLCEAFLLEQEQRAEDVCSLHAENLKLFCLEHQEAICLVCRDSERHAEHKFRPIDEVARRRKEELEASLKPLERVGQQPLWKDPAPPSGPPLDTAKHVGNLTFNIWSKMRDLYFDPGSKHGSFGTHTVG
uniref:Uncharacterized protein n=1 Tax=Fundulus heteroclitus TaxID=8078 RepID=A0A3Q2QI16_FUNHE